MRRQDWVHTALSGALLLALACDAGKTTLAGGGGSSGSPSAPQCTSSSECLGQVCSPEGRCVDCYDDRDCAATESCVSFECIAVPQPGGGSAGTGGGGGGGGVSPGGSGGTTGGTSGCDGAQVLLVIQRSGAMFEEPSEDESYWAMIEEAVVGSEGVAASFGSRLALGALFFVRLQYEEDQACPLVSSAAAQPSATAALQTSFSDNRSAYQALADEQAKMDAPVPEAISAAAAMLQGSSKHLVLITTGVPDSCTLADSNCTVDLAVKAVQDAQQQGVTTHVIGLGDNASLNAAGDEDGYGTYLKQLANAGRGEPVAMSGAFEEQCDDQAASASYTEAGGNAVAYRAETASETRAALQQILSSICP